VETAGVEPASDGPVLQTSTYLVYRSISLSEARQTKLPKSQPALVSLPFHRLKGNYPVMIDVTFQA